MATRRDEQVLRKVRRLGIARSTDLTMAGFSRMEVQRLTSAGVLHRIGRGLYVSPDHGYTERHALALVAIRVPRGVFCLLTALRFHGLTTQSPAEVWVALPEKARRPRIDYPRLRVARFSGPALTQGLEAHVIEGVAIRVYSAAKTVVDCFRYRNKVGTDVAVEALRDFSRQKGDATELARLARVCRVSRVMQPYLDAIL